MRKTVAAALIAATALTGCAVATANQPAKPVPAAEVTATVKIVLPNGHGSAVHIGGGFFLTAAHVTDRVSEVKVRDRAGNVVVGEVLWKNYQLGGYDVSLVYAPTDGLDVGSANLSCAEVVVGQHVHAEGNPLGGEFITFWGRISGVGVSGAEAVNGKAWRQVVTVDMSVAGGMSGGPVYDDETGNVVGIVVAGVGRVSPFMLMVPGDAICHVMGRA